MEKEQKINTENKNKEEKISQTEQNPEVDLKENEIVQNDKIKELTPDEKIKE